MSLFKKLKNKVHRVNLDGETTGKENLAVLQEFSKANKMPIFKGEAKHGYESDFLGYTDKCPNCQSPTEQMMSNFAYATQEKSRIMAAPAGHFCTKCPTVIIDDEMMRQGIDASRFWYGGVFCIETGYSDEPHLFETFNGEKPIMILDEDMQNVGGIVQSVHQNNESFDFSEVHSMNRIKSKQQQKKKANNRKKNKAAKNARKKNRRK